MTLCWMEHVAQKGRNRASYVAKGTGADRMIVFDDLILSLLSSAIVTYVNRGDDAIDDAQKERLEDLKRRVESLRKWDSPEQQVSSLFNEALRDHRQPGSPGAALVKIVPTDPVWGMDLTQWLLEPDPKEFDRKLESLATRLAEASNCEQSAVAAFLTRVHQRIDGHLGLSQLRADQKLNLILDRLCGLDELRSIVERNQFTLLAAFDRLLEDEQRRVLVPVCPVTREPTEDNSLLSGSRPTDEDMHQNLDFERKVFKDVIAAIDAVDAFPCAFLFQAEPQKGKTTFLKRVGWHLAQNGYPVLQVADDGQAGQYAHWIDKCAAKQKSQPLVVLIDDPFRQGEHFTNQLEGLRQRDIRVIILLASRSLDWREVKTDQCPLISDKHLRMFELNPRRGEERLLLEKLVSRGLLGVDRLEAVSKEVEEIPIGERYFHRVIELATNNRNCAISAMVEKALKEAEDSPDAKAFECFYAHVCVPGMLGLLLPENVGRVVFNDDAERSRALAFNEQLPRPAIRVTNSDYSVTHEIYAAEFLAGRDIVAQTRSFVRAFVAHPELGDYVGCLLQVQRRRGLSEMVRMLWEEIADQVTDDHWKACSGRVLSGAWGALLYYLGHKRQSLRANAVAVKKAPDDARPHNNYAIVLTEMDEPEAARKHFEEALRINPESADAHNNYGNLLSKLNEPETARKHYEEALRINPEYAEAHNNYGLLLFEQGELPLSLDHAVRAIRLQTLPGRGIRIPGAFSGRTEDLIQVIESSDSTAERRGGALAFLAALKDERAEELLRQCEDDPSLVPAAEVCKEILAYWTEIVQDDTTEPPPADTSAE
ncbi:MAG: tetratricopeptide repeat protein [Planctomycetes bacterium]|nr:tetratricopeptide repeat protein [Planctomycetota bacterium]